MSTENNGQNPAQADPLAEPDIAEKGFRLAEWTVEPALSRLSLLRGYGLAGAKVMAVLVQLAERPGEAISRQELEKEVWAGTIVSYDALTGAIQKLRKAFDDDSRRPRIIETLSKRGCRLPLNRWRHPAGHSRKQPLLPPASRPAKGAGPFGLCCSRRC